MKIRELLNEAWDATHRFPGYQRPDGTRVPSVDVEVHRNPTRAEFARLLKQHPEGIRGLLLDGGDIVVWDAYAATHGDLEQHYRSAGGWLLLDARTVKLNDIQLYNNEGDCDDDYRYRQALSYIAGTARTNRNLIRLYGRNFPLVGIDNDEDEEYDLTPEWLSRNCCPLD